MPIFYYVKQLNNSTKLADRAACSSLLVDIIPLVMATIRAAAVQIQPSELTYPQFRTVAFLDRHPGQSLSNVAEFLGLTLSSVSKLMDGLVGNGYVRHEVCPEDRRRARLYLTAKGQSMMAQARAQIATQLADRLAGLEAPALQTVTEALEHLQMTFTRVA